MMTIIEITYILPYYTDKFNKIQKTHQSSMSIRKTIEIYLICIYIVFNIYNIFIKFNKIESQSYVNVHINV